MTSFLLGSNTFLRTDNNFNYIDILIVILMIDYSTNHEFQQNIEF